MDYKIEIDGHKGAAKAISKEKIAGKMTFSTTPNGILIIDHTEVDPEFRGQKIGKNLLLEIVEKSRKESLNVIPLCPFANAIFKRDKTIQDVLKDKM